MKVEICIDSRSLNAVRKSVSAAYEGGADTVELCASMEVGGLTPPVEHVRAARRAFRDRPGLVVMIRPHAQGFSYAPEDLVLMESGVTHAAEAGANGVALGVLRPEDHRIAVHAVQRLVDTAHSCGLTVTFHRAFDAVPDRLEALDALIRLGADRILTCGIPWGTDGTALDGVEALTRVIRKAGNEIEIVIGGGVTPVNVPAILSRVPLAEGSVSLHAYGGAQERGRTTVTAVRALVDATRAAAAMQGADIPKQPVMSSSEAVDRHRLENQRSAVRLARAVLEEPLATDMHRAHAEETIRKCEEVIRTLERKLGLRSGGAGAGSDPA